MGRLLSKLPTDVHLGKFLLVATMFRCLDPALTIAAALNSKSPFLTPFGAEEVRDPTHFTSASPAANLSPGQIIDINSIVNGLAAIKRHQTTISADLNELKSSNQLLWQDALSAREKHKKHQDTINRILKFLAGVFGNTGGSVHKEDVVDSAFACCGTADVSEADDRGRSESKRKGWDRRRGPRYDLA
jgi:HrpA-like RNA helicase